MNHEPQYFILRDQKTVGPYSAASLRAMFATREVTGETLFVADAGKDWKPLTDLFATLPDRVASTTLDFNAPFDWADLVLFIALLGGIALGVYYGLVFETVREGTVNVALLNQRLCGLIGGCALALLAVLVQIIRKLESIRTALAKAH